MDNGTESVLDMYLYETSSLLDQLDEILVVGEKIGDFSSDNVNEILRIVHTIGGSSTMVEFGSLSATTHHVGDLFFYVQSKGIESLNSEHKSVFFNLMSRSEDYPCGEVSKAEGGVPPSGHVESFGREINDFLKKVSGLSQDIPSSFDQDPDAAAAIDDTEDSITLLPEDPSTLFYLHVFFDDGAGMENLRAFMTVSSLRECRVDFHHYPGDIDSNPETCQEVVDNGFSPASDSRDITSHAEEFIKPQDYIRSYELVNDPASAPGSEEAPEG